MIDSLLVIQAKAIAAVHSLDGALVCAIIEQESGGDTWAVRYEAAFLQRYVMPLRMAGKIDDTEMMARSTSWGLMQVMGQTARESAWAGPLPALCDPANGIDIGCAVFKKKLISAVRELHPDADTVAAWQQWWADSSVVQRALELWNGGGNPNYAAEVLVRVPSYQ